MGVVLWYKIEFPDLKIKVSSDVYSGDYLVDAEISISYAIGQPGTFEVRFKDVPLPVTQKLADALEKGSGVTAGVKIVISLGYLDDPFSHAEVLTGRVESIESAVRFPPLGSLLTGHEEASFLLLNTVDIYGEKPKPTLAHVAEQNISPAAVAQLIVTKSGAKMISRKPPDPGSPAGQPRDSIAEEAEDAFHLLDKIAARFGAEVLVQAGTVMFGPALQYPPDTGLVPPIPNPHAILALITGDDSLIAIESMDNARLAEFKPVQVGSTSKRRMISDLPPQADIKAYDFTTLGVPSLRAGQLVVASVDGYQNPFSAFRILNITHAFSPQTGYTCSGRAVTFQSSGGNRELSELARGGSAPAIADRIAGKIRDTQAGFPSVDVGKVKEGKAGDRAATLFYRQQPDSAVSSPSVDTDIPEGKSVLLNKPIAAPFAWHNTGLSVPVYPGMRALLNQVRDSRDDAVIAGFLWANEPKMSRPQAKDGDWWLCLPTEVTGSPPQPTGAGANDLTAADGRRVIEAAGLSVRIGKDECTPVGQRPDEGTADVFLITHKSGTTIQIDGQGNVAVEGKGSQVVLKCGGATLTVGDGKVAIS
jgi:hypothetical protein